MRVKCLALEHNAAPRPRLEPGPFDPESSPLTIRPPRLPIKLLSKRHNIDTTFIVFSNTKKELVNEILLNSK